jgi:hypothetical protein
MRTDIVKSWPWDKILVTLACLLIVVGIAPAAALLFGGNRNFFPLQMPIQLKRGEYTSQLFKTDMDENYEIYFDSFGCLDKETRLDMDWKIVDESGALIQQGSFGDNFQCELDRIGEYQAKIGQRQRIIAKIHHDVEGIGAAQPELVVGLPRRQDDYWNVYDLFNAWAVITAGPGALLLLFLLIRRRTRSKQPSAPHSS